MPTGPKLKRELDQLVCEQIEAFKESRSMDDRDLLEFHLRSCRIRAILRELDRHRQWPPIQFEHRIRRTMQAQGC